MKELLLRYFSRGSLYFMKFDLYFLTLRARNFLFMKRTRRVKPQSRFLNVGCGPAGVDSKDWCNLDGFRATGVDYLCDLRRNLPFPNDRFEGVYSEHFFEHLHAEEEAPRFLRESYRILCSGGIIRLSVPDGELYLRKYLEDRDWMLKEIAGREWVPRRPSGRRTPMETVNEVFRQQFQHQFCYDYETMELVLLEAGFTDIRRVDFGAGQRSELLIDKASRRSESLYVEARKP